MQLHIIFIYFILFLTFLRDCTQTDKILRIRDDLNDLNSDVCRKTDMEIMKNNQQYLQKQVDDNFRDILEIKYK